MTLGFDPVRNSLSTAPRKWGTDLAVAHKQSRDREGADEGHDPYPRPFYGAAYSESIVYCFSRDR
jgi:hypothetical protein